MTRFSKGNLEHWIANEKIVETEEKQACIRHDILVNSALDRNWVLNLIKHPYREAAIN